MPWLEGPIEMSVREVATAEGRSLAWYLYSADAADAQIAPQRSRVPLESVPRPGQALTFTDRGDAVRWCDEELPNLAEAVDRAAALGEHAMAWRLPAVLWNYFYLRKPLREWEHMHTVGLRSARSLRDSKAKSLMCNGLASAYRHQRRFSDAVPYYEQAIELHDEADTWTKSWLLNNLAETVRGLGDRERAFGLYQQAIAISEATGDTWSRGCFLTNIGEAYAQFGRYDDAIASYQASLPLRRQHDHVFGEGWTYNGLGEAHQQQGLLDEAMTHYERAIELRRHVDDRFGEAWTLHNIAEIHVHRGRVDEAIATYTRALQLRRDIGDRWGTACSADQLAALLAQQGKHQQAHPLWDEALAVFDELDPNRATDTRQHINSRPDFR